MPYAYVLKKKCSSNSPEDQEYTISVTREELEAQNCLRDLIKEGKGISGEVVGLYLDDKEIKGYAGRSVRSDEVSIFLRKNQVAKDIAADLANNRPVSSSNEAKPNDLPKKKILVLMGTGMSSSEEEGYLSKICDNDQTVEFIFEAISDEKLWPQDTRFDGIIVYAHGSFGSSRQMTNNRYRIKHSIQTHPHHQETVELVKTYSRYTDKILIRSCHAGAIMKDLEDHPVKADVVALTGSKYPLLSYSIPALKIAKRFFNFGVEDLYEFAMENYPDTICIQNKNKSITKLTSVKESKDSSLPTIVRHINRSRLTTLKNETHWRETNSWWVQSKTFRTVVTDCNQAFKDAALVTAVIKGKINDVDFWLQNGSSPNAIISTSGDTPLGLVIDLQMDIKIAQRLLAHGADPDLSDLSDNIDTPLRKAILKKNLLMIEELLSGKNGKKANPNLTIGLGYTPLIYAINSPNPSLEVIKTMLQCGANPDLPDKSGDTPLIRAIILRKDNSLIEALLDAKANPNLQNKSGDTPYSKAEELRYGNFYYSIDEKARCQRILILLIHQGANPDLPDKSGDTPLIRAIRRGDISLVEALLAAKANPNLQNKSGDTPYSEAELRYRNFYYSIDEKERNQEILLHLLHRGANPDLPDKSGDTPLIRAIRREDAFLVKALLDAKANPNLQNKSGDTPYSEAELRYRNFSYSIDEKVRNQEILILLLQCGANPDLPDKSGDTPLIRAIRREDAFLVKVLLDAKANPNLQNKSGESPHSVAENLGNQEILALLLQATIEPGISAMINKIKNEISQTDWITMQNKCSIVLDDGSTKIVPRTISIMWRIIQDAEAGTISSKAALEKIQLIGYRAANEITQLRMLTFGILDNRKQQTRDFYNKFNKDGEYAQKPLSTQSDKLMLPKHGSK